MTRIVSCILKVAILLLFASYTMHAQTQTTTITIVAPASLGTITPTPSHFYQNTAAPVSFASSTNGFNATCTAAVGAVALPVTFVSSSGALTATLTAAMTSGAINSTVTITLTCTPAALTMLSPVVLPNAKAGVAYSASLPTVTGISGGVPPYTWTVNSGSLPAGLTLSSTNGLVTGTPSGAGSSTFGFLVTDSSGAALNFDPRVFDALSFPARNTPARLHS